MKPPQSSRSAKFLPLSLFHSFDWTRAGNETGPRCFYFGKTAYFFCLLSPVKQFPAYNSTQAGSDATQESMHPFSKYPVLVATLLLSTLAWSDCLPFKEARKHVGEIKCVTGMVVRVKQGTRGVHFLDFCDDFRLCPFTVVIFPRDLKNVGDVRQLQGRMIEIHGQVKEYDGRAEIVLEEYRQLADQAPESLRCPRTTTWRKKAATAQEPSAIPSRNGRRPAKKGLT